MPPSLSLASGLVTDSEKDSEKANESDITDNKNESEKVFEGGTEL